MGDGQDEDQGREGARDLNGWLSVRDFVVETLLIKRCKVICELAERKASTLFD